FPLNVVCFRYRPPGTPESELDDLNRRISEAVLTDGRVYVGTTSWGGKVAFRPAFVNWRTTAADTDLILETLRDLGSRPASYKSDLELLEHRVDGDDVTLELELGFLEPRGDADELREVQDRHLEVPASRRFQLRLPRVEREVAEGAWCHHRIGAGLRGLLDRLDQLAHRNVFPRLDDREAAALDLGRVVDRLAATGVDDGLERPGPIRVLETEQLRRPQDLTTIKRRNLESLQPLVVDLTETLGAVVLDA